MYVVDFDLYSFEAQMDEDYLTILFCIFPSLNRMILTPFDSVDTVFHFKLWIMIILSCMSTFVIPVM